MPDPPDVMRAAVIEPPGASGHAARGIRARPLACAERAARARRGRGHQPHRRQDPRRSRRLVLDRVVPRGARLRLQRRRRALAVRIARLSPGHRSVRDAALPPLAGHVRRVRGRAHRSPSPASPRRSRTSRPPGFRSRRSRRGASSSRPPTRTKASGSSSTPAAAASGTSRCSSPRTSGHASRRPVDANAPWLRELGASVVIDYTTTRFEEVVADVDVVIDLVGNRRTRPAPARCRCCDPAGCTSSCRPDRGRATRRRRMPPACA